MKYKYLMLISTLSFSTITTAEPIRWNNVNTSTFNSYGGNQNNYEQQRQEQQRQQQQRQQQQRQQQNYSSSYGNNYQYDLNNGSDRIRYSTDVGAQFRDQNRLPTPSVQMERRQGQYGGGYISE